MSVRKITTSEIAAVGAILQDKEAIKILREINDNIITEEDTKGKRKNNEVFNFVGFTSGDDIYGEDPDEASEEFQNKKGAIKRLVDAGLVLEGFHIPLERKSEKKFGDVRISNTDDKIYKYKLTEEGLTVLALVGNNNNQENNNNNNNGSKATATATTTTAAAATTAAVSKSSSQGNQSNNDNKPRKFVLPERKEDIEAFKIARNKEIGLEDKKEKA